MLKCPTCGTPTKVSYSWFSKTSVRNRRYLCTQGHGFTSQEQVVRVNTYTPGKSKAHNVFAAKVAAS